MNPYDDPAFFHEYAQMSRSRYGLNGAGEWPQLQPLFPELTGKTVLDLGCGYGWHCQYAAEQGATSVLGIDQSVKMIREARTRNNSDCIRYQVCDLLHYDYPAETYDLVISNLVLHYVEDLETIYSQIFKTLKSDGAFLMNIEHPVFTAGVNQHFSADGTWPVAAYYYPGKRKTDFLGYPVSKQHHTLTQILMGLIHTGFRIEVVEEAMPPVEWRAQMPEEMQRPMMLLVKAKKEDS